MNDRQKVLILTSLSILFLLSGNGFSQIDIDPFGFSIVPEEEVEEFTIRLTNNSESNISYQTDIELLQGPEERRIGPRRDDLGEILDEFNINGAFWTGLVWDGNLMWGMDYENQQMTGVDINGEPQEQIRIGRYVGACWDGEAIWAGDIDNTSLVRIDLDGDVLETIRVQDPFPFGVAWDGEMLWYSAFNEEGMSTVRQIDLDGEIQQSLDMREFQNPELVVLAWVPEHLDGPLWILDCNGCEIYQVNIDGDEPEIIQDDNLNAQTAYGIEHDGENMWHTTPEGSWFVFDDGVEEFAMLGLEPEEGVIQAEQNLEITATISTAECPEGVYDILLSFIFSEQVEERRDDIEDYVVEMSVVVCLGEETAILSGSITDSETEAVIENALIEQDLYLLKRWSDQEGNYEISNLPLNEYEFTFSAPNYLSHTEVIDLNQDAELDVALLHAECNLSREDVFIQLEPVVEVETDFSISNDGNGPLSYTSEKRLVGDPVEPWGIYGEAELEDIIDDPSLQGVVFANGLFYVSGGYDGNEDTSYIYVLSQEEGLVDQFMQFNASRYGMRDLAYDGEHLWGIDGNVIYEFTTDGEEISTIQSPRNPSRAIAYDPDLDLIWVADITSDLYGLTRDGEVAVQYDRPGEVRFYGLAYWPDDPDDYNLYAFSRPSADEPIEICKIDTETGEIMLEATLTDFEGRPGGAFITSELDPYHWLFVSLIQRPYKISVFEIEPRRDWFQHSPTEGVIEAGNSQEFTLVLDARGLPIETFEGEIVFYHDGIGSMTILPVTLDVVEGEVQTFRELELGVGWNTVSVGLRPEPSDVTEIMSELVENGSLIMMKNGAGDFFWPEYEHNDISGWYVDEGYQIKMSRPGGLRLEGMSVLADHPIELESGWSLISYYPRIDVEATLALSNLEDVLLIAKDGSGNFYVPAWEFSNMGDLSEGNAYYVNIDVEEPLEFVYTTGFEAEENESFGFNFDNAKTGVLPEHAVTGYNMSILVMSETPGEIGVYADGNLVGSGLIQNGRCGIAVWGDDPSTEEIDGARDGEALEIRLLDGSGANVAEYEVLEGGSVYRTNTFSALKVSGTVEMPVEFGIVSAYPNPFNAMTRISYGLEHSGRIDLSVYDLTGRRVAELFSGEANAGVHTIQFNAEGFASGMYMLNLRSADRISQMKIVLVK